MSRRPSVPPLPDLPVREALGDIRDALARDRRAVLIAPPGAGKTTLVPLALLEEPWLGSETILVLEPRRLAARAAAWHMSRLVGETEPGGTVGYRVRMDTRVGPRTRVELVTEGVLTRMLQSDPALRGVGLVIFDEFHERSLHADLGLALALQARRLFRPDLRLMVMSATLDAEPVAALLDGAPVLESRGRRHPVETRWLDAPVRGWIEPVVADRVRAALEEESGDVLVFLPGAREIRRTAEALEAARLPAGVEVLRLHGSLSAEAQDRAVRPAPDGRRKVVLSSAIAESSLTIDGVRVVVDAGLMRVPRFDPGTGMTRLETVRVSRDSADQRRGRAGRTGPGVCYRLWTPGEERGLVPGRTPEILEADLAPLALELAAWGSAPDDLRWLDPPPAASFAQARELLGELDALDAQGSITAHGRAMAELGLHPRLAHMLLRARDRGWAATACHVAALLGERDILRAEGRAPDADLRLRVEALGRAGAGGSRIPATVRGQRVDRRGLHRALRESRHWSRMLGVERRGERGSDEDVVGVLAAWAYPDRIGRRREGERGRFLLRNGRGARFAEPQPLAGADWLVAVAVEGRGRDARIFQAAPLSLEAVEEHFAAQVQAREEVFWDSGAERVRARWIRSLGALVLEEGPLSDPAPSDVTAALMEGIRERGLRVLPWTREVEQLRHRLAFLHHLEPGSWPEVSDEALLAGLDGWLAPFAAGMRSLDDLRRLALDEALLSRLDWKDRQRLDHLAPERIEVPSGSRILLDYSDPTAPALAVRLQEVFGLSETPRIGGGRVPLLMKLLSPARRPVQVTRDLASFWRDAYHEVRKDMRGRYPKHAWPEDPLSAEPLRGTPRRRG